MKCVALLFSWLSQVFIGSYVGFLTGSYLLVTTGDIYKMITSSTPIYGKLVNDVMNFLTSANLGISHRGELQ